jgi:hypothetical protein
MRILSDQFLRRSPREVYWSAARLGEELARLHTHGSAPFRSHARRDLARYVFGTVRPIDGETEARARAAASWLLRAQAATSDHGVSLGYFPWDHSGSRWRPSYPETTGYIITSLLFFSEHFGDPTFRQAALRMARWEIEVQMPSGAVQGGPVCPPERQTPAAFNTGMVLDGWCSAYERENSEDILAAARRAANFLVADLDEHGYYRTNGAFVSAGEIKTYTCLCAWAIYRFGNLVDEAKYRSAAIRSIEAALKQQHANGWFAHNCLARSDAPLTHTIGYALQGILEVGLLAKREDFVAAVQRTVQAIAERVQDNGYLPGTFYDDWEPASFSSCLTGSAQLAVVAYRLFESNGELSHRVLADKLTNFLKPLQAIDAGDEAINGAIAGSFPLFGEYMRGGYPNWATKYFLDALLLQQRVRSSDSTEVSKSAARIPHLGAIDEAA